MPAKPFIVTYTYLGKKDEIRFHAENAEDAVRSWKKSLPGITKVSAKEDKPAKSGQARCDHCKKWVGDCDLLIPDIDEKYQDGSVAVCEKCTKNHRDREYWNTWIQTKEA